MKRILKKYKPGNIVWILFMALTVSTTVSAFTQRVMGVKIPKVWGTSIAFVQTGSMEPSIPTGSVILVHEQDSYQEGDIITYHHETLSAPVTHRIIEINGEIITTRGDANNTPDPEFLQNQIVGKVYLTIPYLGYVLSTVQKPIILIPLLGLLVLSIFFEPQKEKLERKNDTNEDNTKKGAVAMTGNGDEL